MRVARPTPRLRDIPIGDPVKLRGVDRVLTVAEIRDDGYINLNNGTKLVVTASPCHEVEEIK